MEYVERAQRAAGQALAAFRERPRHVQALWIAAVVAILALDVALFVFHRTVLRNLVAASQYWESLGLRGMLALGVAIFLVSFPPLIGFSFLVTVTGAVYGLSKGFVIVALGSTLGSLCAFALVQRQFRTQTEALVANNHALRVLSMAVRGAEDSLVQEALSMMLIRVLPLPYSLTNGAIACVPGSSAWCYGVATLIVSPKNLVTLFVGRQMRRLGENEGGSLSDWGLIVLAIGVYSAVSFLVYRNTMARMEREGFTGEPDAPPAQLSSTPSELSFIV